MRHFTSHPILSLPVGERKNYIPPCGSWSVDFTVPETDIPVTHRLRLKGETDFFWRWRMERGAPHTMFPLIDDALTTKDTFHEKFALEFIGKPDDDWQRNFYTKVKKDNFAPGENYIFSIPVKGENLKINDGGRASAVLEIYVAKEGRHPDDIYDEPDHIIELKFPEGSYDWELCSTEFKMPENAVCLLFHAGTFKTTGRLLAGSPVLKAPMLAKKMGEFNSHTANAVSLSTSVATADTVLPPLGHAQYGEILDNYFGENLSRREFLECIVTVDGKEIFRGEKYASIVRGPDFSFNAGTLAPGKHTFSLTLTNDYENAVGFLPSFLELHELGNHEFELIGAPEAVTENDSFAALIRVNHPGITVSDSFGNSHYFEKAGLYAFQFSPLKEEYAEIKLFSDNQQDSFAIRRTAASTTRIFLSSGDAIYIENKISDMEEFLEWYIENHIGNSICFRHSYRWGGARVCNEKMWRHIIPLLNDLKIYYTVMVDGREVQGMNSNPPEELLQGPYYIGRRAHENDGAFNYWGTDNLVYEEPASDIMSKGVDSGGIMPHIRPVHKGEQAWLFYDPTKAGNCKEAAEYFVENLRVSRGDSTRHSGPSALYRYFFQAGYKNLLAEQMYCAEDVLLSSLRGASKAYDAEEFGTHLAMQWSSLPHDTQEHSDRYFLSLALSYIHGASEINMEEGLWRIESHSADFDRFSSACRRHMDSHQKFRKFLDTHPRTGKLITPLACIQGRYDGWLCFGRDDLWHQWGDEWKFGKAEESFDMLNIFYPRSKLDAIYCVPCPCEPQGWYTGMPYGAIDLAPVETDWHQYDSIIFLGWHSFVEKDAELMLEYVKNGGKLLLSRRHLNCSLKRNEKLEYPEYCGTLKELLGENWRNESGMISRNVGKGTVYFLAEDLYPAEESVKDVYSSVIRDLAANMADKESEKGWIMANDDVAWGAYELPDGSRRFYLLNIRWWDRKSSEVTLRFGQKNQLISVPFGEIVTVSTGMMQKERKIMSSYDSEFQRKEFTAADGFKDWYLVRKGDPDKPCVVVLHGHGSFGDQLICRKDVIEFATSFLVENDFNIISPNYRGNSWMCETVQDDLIQILTVEKPLLQWNKLFISAGSMGGTSAMIFAMRHREHVDGIAVQGGATDPESYIKWLEKQDVPILQEIKEALQKAFPTEELRQRNSVLANFEKLSGLPIFIAHGGADEIIPVEQVRALNEKMAGEKNFFYEEIAEGNHDSPLGHFSKQLKALMM